MFTLDLTGDDDSSYLLLGNRKMKKLKINLLFLKSWESLIIEL